MERITSTDNARIKRLALLQQKAKLRRQEQSFVIEGVRLFLDTPDEFIREVYVDESEYRSICGNAPGDIAKESVDTGRRLLEKLERHTVFVVSKEAMKKASDTQTPQGILAVVQLPQYSMEDVFAADKPLLLLLEDIQDPGNLGTMIRTAEAAGAAGVIMSAGTVDITNPKVVRATMSALFRVPYLYTEDLKGVIHQLREHGTAVYAAYLDRSAAAYDSIDYTGSCAVLIGNEGNGLTEETAQAADRKIVIPMEGKIESLNAAMSAGILLYEAHRQRKM